MAELLIRNIDEHTKKALAVQAARHGVSQQAEALRIIREALEPESKTWVDLVRENAESVGGMEFEAPERHVPRLTGIEV